MNNLNYRPSPDIGMPIAERLRNFPREPGMLAYAVRSIAALVLRAWMRLYYRLRVEGREPVVEVPSLQLDSSAPVVF